MRKIALQARQLFFKFLLSQRTGTGGVRLQFPDGEEMNFGGQGGHLAQVVQFQSWADLWRLANHSYGGLANAYAAGRIASGDNSLRELLRVMLSGRAYFSSECVNRDHWWNVRHTFNGDGFVSLTHMLDIGADEMQCSIDAHYHFWTPITEAKGHEFWRRRLYWLVLTEVAFSEGYIKRGQLRPSGARRPSTRGRQLAPNGS